MQGEWDGKIGYIYRRNTDNVKKADGVWWWTIENYVSRDQISNMYALLTTNRIDGFSRGASGKKFVTDVFVLLMVAVHYTHPIGESL